MKALKILAAILGLFLIAIGVTLAIGIPGGFVTDLIERRVEAETGYQLDIDGGATIRLWPLTVVTLHDVSLHDPKDRDIPERFRAQSVRAELSLRSLVSGKPRIRELTIAHAVTNLPMSRERPRFARALTKRAEPANTSTMAPVTIDQVTMSDATVVFKDVGNRIESRVEHINLRAAMTADRLDIEADARAGDQPIKLEAKATVPTQPADGLTIPVDFKIDATGLLPQTLAGNADVKLNGNVITINGLTGMLGNARFSGYASIEATVKPLVKLDLDFKQLDIDAPAALAGKSSSERIWEGWSDEPFSLEGLNYVDADFQVSAAALNAGSLRLAPAKIEGSLASGILKMTLNELGLYEGRAAAGLAIDASIARPIYALRANLRDVRARPLLTSLTDFTSLDGRMQTQLDVRSTGRSQRELLSNLSGTANLDFQDGQIRGINVAQMIRSLTASTLSGWQESDALSTDLTELHASFRIDKGKAETNDLRLAGPLVRVTGTGSADLTARSLAFRLEPKLVMTTQGQGSRVADPVGLGIPVKVEGAWSSPKIYPDMAGILDDPAAAFAKLREMGQGLFGSRLPDGQSGDSPDKSSDTGDRLIEGLGNIIQGLGGGSASQDRAATTPTSPASPAPQTGQAAPSARDTQKQIDSIIRQLFGR
ncbi:cell envelope biogenesis protein AsmA [Afipia sp. P52-10]|uniref:AsmA family protein n=1 Tax=Afipia sp. P52-10 TaxID=1429916 RepID=UPI0003DF2772|nr:AsmA family protein [Afipia sp. P52-10]ETR78122.1 cell envelope biogenesis protein AsmA [Afipia sp. P52-10]